MSLFQVLVVDEDPKFTSGVASVLQRASRETGRAKGLVVLRATDVRRAFEVLNRDPVRMIFYSAELKGSEALTLADQFLAGYGHLPQYVFGRAESDNKKMQFLQKGIQRYFRRPVTRAEANIIFDVIAAYAADIEKNPSLVKQPSGPPPELPPAPASNPSSSMGLSRPGSGPAQAKPNSGSGSVLAMASPGASDSGMPSASSILKSIPADTKPPGSGKVDISARDLAKGNDLPNPDHSGNLMASEALAGLMNEFDEPDLDVLISMDSTILEAPEDPVTMEELTSLDERLGPAMETVGQTIVDILGVQNPTQLQVRTPDRIIIVQVSGNARSIGVTRDLSAPIRSIVKALDNRFSEHTAQ